MSERFYKIGNTWYPWQTAHGLYGYTKTPTIRITYISTSQATWGQPESGYGFFDGDASEPQDGSYFHTSTWGWFDADSMAKTIWLMPSECEIDDIFFENDGDISPGARLIIDPSVSIDEEDWRYLIASVRNLGWHTLDEWEELGWVLSDPNTLYFGGDFSGNNIRMESVDGGGGMIDKYASYKTLFEMRGWEPGGLFIDKPQMMGICGVLTETSDSVLLVEVPNQLSVGRIEFTGSLAEGGIPESGVVEEYVPPTDYIDVFLYLDSVGAQKTFSANDYWFSYIIDDTDKESLRSFGVQILIGVGGNGCLDSSNLDTFDIQPIGLFSGVRTGDLQADMSNFYCDVGTSSYTDRICIFSINAYGTLVKSWKCRITRKPAPEDYLEIDLGLRWNTSSSGWMSKTFSNNDWWWAGILSNDDLVALRAFGGDIIEAGPSDGKFAGLIGALAYDEAFDYELIDMFSSIGTGSVTFDKTNFNLVKNTSQSSNYSNSLLIASIYAFSTACMTYRVRITRKPAPALPTVSTENDFDHYNWLSPYSGPPRVISMESGEILDAYYNDTELFVYQDTKSYGVIQWQTTNGTKAGSIEVSVVKHTKLVALKNVSSNTISITAARVAVCSDNQAEVVTVFNSSDEAFNAFKFTANGTDYYYVLDNTQTDWTDDLSGIGYHLPPTNLIGYMTEEKAAVTVRSGSPKKMYDSSGNLIPFDSTRQYTMICYYSYDGGDPLEKPAQMGFTNVEGSLGLFATNSKSFIVQRVEYTES